MEAIALQMQLANRILEILAHFVTREYAHQCAEWVAQQVQIVLEEEILARR